MPARYWSASSGPIQGRNRCLKKRYPISAIENGFTSQLTTSVTISPLGRFRTPRIEVKSTLSIIG